jgi:hypothetical protein
MLSPRLGITKEIMSRGPQVPYMECQDSDNLSIALEGPSFIQVQSTYRQQHHPSHWPGPEVAMGLAP